MHWHTLYYITGAVHALQLQNNIACTRLLSCRWSWDSLHSSTCMRNENNDESAISWCSCTVRLYYSRPWNTSEKNDRCRGKIRSNFVERDKIFIVKLLYLTRIIAEIFTCLDNFWLMYEFMNVLPIFETKQWQTLVLDYFRPFCLTTAFQLFSFSPYITGASHFCLIA